MNEFLTILSQPITQLGGIIGIIVLLQRAGLDIGGIIRSFLGVRAQEAAEDATADLRNDFQKLLMGQETLSLHFNHETTNDLTELKDGIVKMHEMQSETNQALKEIIKYGIVCRKK